MSSTTWTPELESHIRAIALDAGFHIAAIAPASGSSPNLASADTLDATRFAAWVEAGHAGEMDYLKRRDPTTDAFLRSDLRVAIPWARSIVLCALNYNAPAPTSLAPAPPTSGWIARYAWSGRTPEPAAAPTPPPETLIPTDYHNELLTRLRQVESHLHSLAPCETRCYVDTGPILERSFAARAGIGWIGKNTCVINQHLGSWLLLGVLVTSLPIPEASPTLTLAPDRCGSCTRCLDACPTDALIAPHQMDASRCIAYLTIEKKGAIPEDLRAPIGRQVFGCDICQDVCPWNRRAPIAITPGMLPRLELVNPPLAELAALDNPTFKRLFKGSPLERTGRKRLHRNVAIAMGNSGQPEFLPQLEAWAADSATDPIRAEAAQWAIACLDTHTPSQPKEPAKTAPPEASHPTP